MASKVSDLLQSRFRASLLGVLVGDCCGAVFEGRYFGQHGANEQLELVINPSNRDKLTYTDDTAMTKTTCLSLIKNEGLNAKQLARDYSEAYFGDPKRGYGGAVRDVFKLLRDSDYQDPYGPAAKQFDGNGSFGNGAAMRCNGIGLFTFKKDMDDEETLELVRGCSRITHSNVLGIHGAVVLVTAIRYLLKTEPDGLVENDFLDHLIGRMKSLEDDTSRVFTDKLGEVKQICAKVSITGLDITQEEVVSVLGNDVSAHGSVPLAVYSFLRGVSKFSDSYGYGDDEFLRTLHWAISCGGDTDTIASMACGLSGAYLGLAKIPEYLYKRCESWQEMIKLADELAAK